MGKRDKSGREAKKPGKNAKKINAASVLPPPVMVEVIRKGKKDKEEF